MGNICRIAYRFVFILLRSHNCCADRGACVLARLAKRQHRNTTYLPLLIPHRFGKCQQGTLVTRTDNAQRAHGRP